MTRSPAIPSDVRRSSRRRRRSGLAAVLEGGAARAFAPALRIAAGLLFIVLFVVAPLNYGSTRAGGPGFLALGCITATMIWAASCLLERRLPRIPGVVLAASGFIVLMALLWRGHVFNLTAIPAFTREHSIDVAMRWPHSILALTSDGAAILAAGLGLAILPLIDLARNRGWALAFSTTLVVTGVVVALLALAQNVTGAPGIYWRPENQAGNIAGPFFHHTSAGAWFNTVWPLGLALAWLAWNHSASTQRTRALAVLGGIAAVVLVAAHGSHVSRFPQVAALLVAPFLLRRLPIGGSKRWIPVCIGIAAVALLVSVAGRGGEIGARWKLMFKAPPPQAAAYQHPPQADWDGLMRDDLFIPSTADTGPMADRVEAWRTAGRAIATRPLTGHGPANWIAAAGWHSADPFVRTFYLYLQFTHNDLLQVAAEWGAPFAFAWAILLVGGVVNVVRTVTWQSRAHRRIGIAAACGVSAVLLQSLLDFPLHIPAIAFNATVLAALGWAASAPETIADA